MDELPHDDPRMAEALLAWAEWAYLECRHHEAWLSAMKGRAACDTN